MLSRDKWLNKDFWTNYDDLTSKEQKVWRAKLADVVVADLSIVARARVLEQNLSASYSF